MPPQLSVTVCIPGFFVSSSSYKNSLELSSKNQLNVGGGGGFFLLFELLLRKEILNKLFNLGISKAYVEI